MWVSFALCVSVYLVLCFVFFFKQKTAYEMRISDWSSDVCSSDLEGRRLAAEFERHRDQIVGRGAHDVPPDAGRAGEDQMVEGKPREGDADVGAAGEHRHLALVEIIGHQPRHHRGGVFGELAGLDHRAIARGEDARSEEHTSELQSLMRISYAVFCLKKKNKTHTNTS